MQLAWWTVMSIEGLVLGHALQAGAPEFEIVDDAVRTEFPLVARVVDELKPRAADPDAFNLGLEALIAGIAQWLP